MFFRPCLTGCFRAFVKHVKSVFFLPDAVPCAAASMLPPLYSE